MFWFTDGIVPECWVQVIVDIQQKESGEKRGSLVVLVELNGVRC